MATFCILPRHTQNCLPELDAVQGEGKAVLQGGQPQILMLPISRTTARKAETSRAMQANPCQRALSLELRAQTLVKTVDSTYLKGVGDRVATRATEGKVLLRIARGSCGSRNRRSWP
jgi:hypothetical protein